MKKVRASVWNPHTDAQFFCASPTLLLKNKLLLNQIIPKEHANLGQQLADRHGHAGNQVPEIQHPGVDRQHDKCEQKILPGGF